MLGISFRIILQKRKTLGISFGTIKLLSVPNLGMGYSETHGIPQKEHFSLRNNENRFRVYSAEFFGMVWYCPNLYGNPSSYSLWLPTAFAPSSANRPRRTGTLLLSLPQSKEDIDREVG
jgi:hypothetical protein